MKKVMIFVAMFALQAFGFDFFAKVDTDGDGQVMLDEYMAHQQRRAREKGGTFNEAKVTELFRLRDLNGDGLLTREEFASEIDSSLKKPQSKKSKKNDPPKPTPVVIILG